MTLDRDKVQSFDILVIDDSDDEIERKDGGVAIGALPKVVRRPNHNEHMDLTDSERRGSEGKNLATLASANSNLDGEASAVIASKATNVLPSRAEMERGRLERQRKREAESPGRSSGPNGSVTVQNPPYRIGPAAKRPRVALMTDLNDANDDATRPKTTSFATESSSTTPRIPTTINSGICEASSSSVRYWNGSLKRVKNVYEPDTDSVSLADIIGPKDELKLAIVGAYCLDIKWVSSHFRPETPLLLISHGSSSDARGIMQVDETIKPSTYLMVPPGKATGKYPGNMHIKCLVLFYEKFCRLAVPTANMMDYDWQQIDNACYLFDFPLLTPLPPSKDPRANPSHTKFSLPYLNMITDLCETKAIDRFVEPFRAFDFSCSKDVALVVSKQGLWKTWDRVQRGGGLSALAQAVNDMGFDKNGGNWEIEATGSSIGQYSNNWMAQMLGACSGILPSTYFRKGCPTPPQLQSPGKNSEAISWPIKIIFPTLEEVENSHGGKPGGGTLFFPRKHWEGRFPRHLLYRGKSKRERVIAHTKHILALRKPYEHQRCPPPSGFKWEGWIYVGSHNFTSAAWGVLQNSSEGPAQLSIHNHEVGVVLPIRGRSEAELEEKANSFVTYKRPVEKYQRGDVPWMQEDHLR